MIIIIITIICNEKEGNKKSEIKPKKRQVIHNAIAHHPLTDAQPVPEQPSASPSQLPPVYILGMASFGMEYPFGHFGSAVLAVSPPSFLCPSSLLVGWA